MEVAAPQSNTLLLSATRTEDMSLEHNRAVPSLARICKTENMMNEHSVAIKHCQGGELVLPAYYFFPYKAGPSHQVLDRFSFGRDAQPMEQSEFKDAVTITIVDNLQNETGGQEEDMSGRESHLHEDLTSHGSGVMPEPNSTTLPEKGWEGRRETGMPWTGGPGDQESSEKEERRGRRKSQNFSKLCELFERGVGEQQGRLSDNFEYQSKDTYNPVGVSNFVDVRGEDTQQKETTFSSLRALWEHSSSKPARNPILRQRKLSLTNGGLLLVKTVTNKRKGGDQYTGSPGKRTRPG